MPRRNTLDGDDDDNGDYKKDNTVLHKCNEPMTLKRKRKGIPCYNHFIIETRNIES
jgi:hypothetical protein